VKLEERSEQGLGSQSDNMQSWQKVYDCIILCFEGCQARIVCNYI
jgi:hypothetical protein